MSSFESVRSSVTTLNQFVNLAMSLDQADLMMLFAQAQVNKLLLPQYVAASMRFSLVTGQLRVKLQVLHTTTMGGPLARSSSVPERKEREASQLNEKAEALEVAAGRAETLRSASVDWMGTTSDLYRDTAQAAADGLRDMANSYRTYSTYCSAVSQFHKLTYGAVAGGIAGMTGRCLIGGGTFNIPGRSQNCLQVVDEAIRLINEGGQGKIGEFMIAVASQTSYAKFNANPHLGSQFVANPEQASVRSHTTNGGGAPTAITSPAS